MSNIHQINAKFNPNVKISNDAGDISIDGGLVLIQEFFHSMGLKSLLENNIPFQSKRSNASHEHVDVLLLILFQLIAGYGSDCSHDTLKDDPALKILANKETLPSQSTVSRTLAYLAEYHPDALRAFNQLLTNQVQARRQQTELIVDLDSTYSECFGQQEGSDYNTHYQNRGYHPLVAFDGIHGDFLDAILRPGNVYTSDKAVEMLKDIVAHFKTSDSLRQLLVRADSGFASPAIYDLCEQEGVDYLIRLKSNAVLQRLAYLEIDTLTLGQPDSDLTRTETFYFDFEYKAQSWAQPRRVCCCAKRPAGELLYHFSFIVTTLETIPPHTVLKAYRKRGTMENYIKEAKLGFYFDKTNSSSFAVNQIRLQISQLAYNLMNFFKAGCLPTSCQTMQMVTLRDRLIKVAVKITRHARKIYYKLATSHVYSELFFKTLNNVYLYRW